MKYSNTHPSTEPSAAINAYSGIRAGCCMESSISSRSLMTGNVSTEESRKEIRRSPGAPSPPANATTFCFHPFKLVANRNSSDSMAAICLCLALDLSKPKDAHLQLLRKGRAIEMIHEDLHQRRPMKIRQLGNLADHPDMAKSFDGFAVLAVLIADEHHAMHRQLRRVQRRQRQQCVIHRAHRVKRRAQQRGQDSLAHTRIRAGDEKMMSHARPATVGEATHSETSTHFRFPSWRKLLLAAPIRAAPDDCLLRMDSRLYRVNGLQT